MLSSSRNHISHLGEMENRWSGANFNLQTTTYIVLSPAEASNVWTIVPIPGEANLKEKREEENNNILFYSIITGKEIFEKKIVHVRLSFSRTAQNNRPLNEPHDVGLQSSSWSVLNDIPLNTGKERMSQPLNYLQEDGQIDRYSRFLFTVPYLPQQLEKTRHDSISLNC